MSRAGAPLAFLGLYFSTIHSKSVAMRVFPSHARSTVRLWNSQISKPRSPSPPANKGEQNRFFLQKLEKVGDSGKSSAGISVFSLGATVADVNLSQSVPFELVMAQVHGGRNMHFGAYETWRRAIWRSQGPRFHSTLFEFFARSVPSARR